MVAQSPRANPLKQAAGLLEPVPLILFGTQPSVCRWSGARAPWVVPLQSQSWVLGNCRNLMLAQHKKNISKQSGWVQAGGRRAFLGWRHLSHWLDTGQKNALTHLPLSYKRVTSKGRGISAGNESKVAPYSCTGYLLNKSRDVFHIEQHSWSHMGYNPSMLAWKLWPGKGGFV